MGHLETQTLPRLQLKKVLPVAPPMCPRSGTGGTLTLALVAAHDS